VRQSSPGAIINTADSSLNSQAASLHQSAQSDRVVVVEQLLEDFEPLNQVNFLGASMLSRLSYQKLLEIMENEVTITHDDLTQAEKQMTTANRLDVQAGQIDDEAARGQLTSQIALGLGSALFGAVLGWVITQALAELRWRRENESKSG
jgi:hypothetical protein